MNFSAYLSATFLLEHGRMDRNEPDLDLFSKVRTCLSDKFSHIRVYHNQVPYHRLSYMTVVLIRKYYQKLSRHSSSKWFRQCRKVHSFPHDKFARTRVDHSWEFCDRALNKKTWFSYLCDTVLVKITFHSDKELVRWYYRADMLQGGTKCHKLRAYSLCFFVCCRTLRNCEAK